MARISHRNLVLAALAAPVSVVLAACGSVAVNTSGVDESLSPEPSATPVGIPPALASKAAASASARASHAAASAHATAKPGTVVRPPAMHATKPTSHTTGVHTVAPTGAVITVTPSTNLADGQTVTIRGAHFKPGVSVIIVECVDHGANTQNTNCTGNGGLFGIPSGFTPAANGTFTKTFVVHKSFSGMGGGYNSCSSSSPCLISVTEPNNNPSEEADAPIRFR